MNTISRLQRCLLKIAKMGKENVMKTGVQDLRTAIEIKKLQHINILLKFRTNCLLKYFSNFWHDPCSNSGVCFLAQVMLLIQPKP